MFQWSKAHVFVRTATRLSGGRALVPARTRKLNSPTGSCQEGISLSRLLLFASRRHVGRVSPEQGHLNSMSPPREYVSGPEMGIEVWVPTNVVRPPPPERYVSPRMGFVNVMFPLVGFVS